MKEGSGRPHLVRPGKAIVVILALALGLAGCDTASDAWNSVNPFRQEKAKVKLKGKRIPVLVDQHEIKPDPTVAGLSVVLPPETTNPDWPQSGGNPAHDLQNLALSPDLKQVWSVSVGNGEDSDNPHLPAPVIGGGLIFTMDTSSTVRAFSPDTGAQLWSANITPKGAGEPFLTSTLGIPGGLFWTPGSKVGDVGGGLAYAAGSLYVTDAFGEALALDAKTGKVRWRRDLQGPTRAAPTVVDNRVFVVTQDNQLHTLDAKTGTVLWTHSGLFEVTDILGAASPAYLDDTVIVPYTSGEIYALRADNGRMLWSDTLAAIRRADAISAVADIRANPVIDRDRVFAISHSGRMTAIDMHIGARAWEDPIGGISQPWVAGKFVFALTTTAQVVCLTRDEGRVRWVVQLDKYQDPEKKEGLIVWHGPVLAGDKLLLTSTTGKLVELSPLNGKVTQTIDLGDPTTLPPIVANRTLYVLTSPGDLKAYR